jgi:hypothetical protein
MTQTAIMSDANDKRALGAVAAKMRQRLADREHDLLYQIFPDAGHRLIAERQERNGRAVLAQDAIKLLFPSGCFRTQA